MVHGVQWNRLAASFVLACIFLSALSACQSQVHVAGPSPWQPKHSVPLLEQVELSLQNTSNISEHPSNITGTFKGTWTKGALNSKLDKLPLFKQKDGIILYQIKTVLSEGEGSHSGVQDVEGELVVRHGVYVTEDDILMNLRGVYVPEVGKLQAVLEPSQAVLLELDQEELALQSPEYRQALRDLAREWSAPLLGQQQSWSSLVLRGQQPLQKRCNFMLNLTVTQIRGQNPDGNPNSLLSLGESGSGLGMPGLQDAAMNGSLYSDNCGVRLDISSSTTHIEAYYAKAVNYTLMITGVSFIQVLLLIRQMESTQSQAGASKVSLLTIGQQAIMDAYLCLLHLTTGIIVEPLFNAFATAAFFEFVIFAIFEMRYLLTAWRARRGSNLDPYTAQRELSILYARFYGALLGGIFITYHFQRWMVYVLFGLFSFWVPQIVYCARNDVGQPLRPLYLIGISITRLALPLYLYGCPHNLLRVSPSPGLCCSLVLWVAGQVAVLLWQKAQGPRCFVPKRFLPPKYDYFRTPPTQTKPGAGGGDIESGDGSVECVICMNPLDVNDARGRMLAPCNHLFHRHCLERWMEVKMECPTCRRVLPMP